MRTVLSLTVFFLVFVGAKAQQDKDLSALIADIFEAVADKNEENGETNIEQLIEHFTYLSENPLNINTATENDLSQLMMLSRFQIFSLKEYIKEFGYLMSINELNLVTGFDENTVSKIKPFITAVEPEKIVKQDFKKMMTRGNNTLLVRGMQRQEKAKGYLLDENSEGQRYLGSPYGLFMRYRYKYRNNLQIGFTADKDQGEEFFKGSNRQGFDFYSFHVAISEIKHLKKLVAGDFRANFGQGLNLWNGFSMGKNSDPHSIIKQNNGFSAYSSADEVTFLRGIASTLQYGNWEISPFVSYKKIDATMENEAYTSLTANGLHRTQNEIARKNTLPETVAGINLAFGETFRRVGITCLYGHYGGKDQRDIKPYNLFDLHGSSNANLSIDYKWMIKHVSLFGEAGISSNGGKALISGISVDINHLAQLSALYRNYQSNYQAVYSNAFGENGKTANEQGLYLGFSIVPEAKWKISTFFDMFSFPWLRYGINSPSSGQDFVLQTNYTPHNDFDFYVKLQYDKALKNLSITDSAVSPVQNIERTRLVLNASYNLSNELSMNSRIAFNFFSPEFQSLEKGFLMYQDIKYKLKNIPLSFSLRYSIFSTDSWNSRLYAYESDILYAFSVPAYYDRGSRYYLNINYKPHKKIQLWFRVSQTYFFGKEVIGSGLSAIQGNKITDIKLQAQLKF